MANFHERDNAIERIASEFNDRGFNGGPVIVYRDSVRVGLALAFLANRLFHREVKISLAHNEDWCVIGTQYMGDNTNIRTLVAQMANHLQQLKP